MGERAGAMEIEELPDRLERIHPALQFRLVNSRETVVLRSSGSIHILPQSGFIYTF